MSQLICLKATTTHKTLLHNRLSMNHRKIQLPCWLGIFGTLLLSSIDVRAVCLDGNIAMEDEVRRSSLVSIANMTYSKSISSEDDPDGIVGTWYEFRVARAIKGQGAHFAVTVENTSSRIFFKKNTEYLIFLQGEIEDGFVDGCGNSQEFQGNENIAELASKIARQQTGLR